MSTNDDIVESTQRLLVIGGAMMILPVAYVSYVYTGYFLDPDFALTFAFSAVVCAGGVMVFFTSLLKSSINEIEIKIKEN